MREEYRKTFLGVQVITLMVTVWTYFERTHSLAASALIFATMQVGAVIGAAWAARLRRKVQRYRALSQGQA